MEWISLITSSILLLVSGYILLRSLMVKAELHRARTVFEVGTLLNSTMNKKKLIQMIMESTARVTQSEGSSVILVDPKTKELYFEVVTGEKEDEVRAVRLPFGEGIAGLVAQTRKSIIVHDVAKDPRWSNRVSSKVGVPTRNLLCVPVLNGEEIVGVLQVINKKNGKKYTEKDLKLLEAITSPTAIALENVQLTQTLDYSMQVLKKTTADKERMISELQIAAEIQGTFLPKSVPLYADEAISAFAYLRPAREVGGDFFDYYYIDEDHLFFTVGDVSDKGIPAALFMVVTVTLLRGKIASGMKTGELLTLVNQELCKRDSTMFATIFCGILHVRTGEMHYSDGGHCTPYLLRENGSIVPLDLKKRVPIGIMPEVEYISQSIVLASEERIILYSDGITEAENNQRELFGRHRLLDALQKCQASNLAEMGEHLLHKIEQFSDGAAQSDDIVLLILARQQNSTNKDAN